MNDDTRQAHAEDERFAKLFAGPVTAPSPEQLQRWQRLFMAELPIVRRRRRVHRALAALAACAAGAVLVFWLGADPPQVPLGAAVAHVETAFGGTVAHDHDGVERSLRAGAQIREGELVESGMRSGLGVTYHSADVRLDARTSVVFHVDRLELTAGRVYLDVPSLAGSRRPESLQVVTPLGTFDHLGTQFLVAVVGGRVSGVVREGVIVLHRPDGDIRLAADTGGGRMVVVSGSGNVRQADAPTSGPLWAWTLRSAPGIAVAGRSPDDVLAWAARERGLRLVYTSAAAERVAHQSRLSGGTGELAEEDALISVDKTTRLDIDDTHPGELRVSLDSEGDQNTH